MSTVLPARTFQLPGSGYCNLPPLCGWDPITFRRKLELKCSFALLVNYIGEILNYFRGISKFLKIFCPVLLLTIHKTTLLPRRAAHALIVVICSLGVLAVLVQPVSGIGKIRFHQLFVASLLSLNGHTQFRHL